MQRDWNVMTDADFRRFMSEFIADHLPDRLRHRLRRIPPWAETRDWYMTLSHAGILAPNWPQEHGGMALSPGKLLIYAEEVERAGVPRLYDMGLFMLGPTLIRRGTEAQIARYLPGILSGEHRWAQGYSEPGSGSDLASLSTRAERDGDAFRINGQKMWVTFLDDATHIFFLARTSDGARKQQGITFFVSELDRPGITRQLMRTLAGYEEFGEVRFDDAVMSQENVVGKVDHGWDVAKGLLDFERLNNGSPKQGLQALNRLERFLARAGLDGDQWIAERVTALRLDLEDQRSTYSHFAAKVRAGQELGPEVSVLKIWSTETFQGISDLFLEIAGAAGIKVEDEFSSAAAGALATYYNARPATIYSGTNEIQRNIIARRVLGLPAA